MATPKKSSGSRNPAAAPSKDRPVRVVRIRNIRGNIWANRLPSGQGVVYNVTIDRLWRDDDQANEGGEVIKKGEWHQSQWRMQRSRTSRGTRRRKPRAHSFIEVAQILRSCASSIEPHLRKTTFACNRTAKFDQCPAAGVR